MQGRRSPGATGRQGEPPPNFLTTNVFLLLAIVRSNLRNTKFEKLRFTIACAKNILTEQATFA